MVLKLMAGGLTAMRIEIALIQSNGAQWTPWVRDKLVCRGTIFVPMKRPEWFVHNNAADNFKTLYFRERFYVLLLAYGPFMQVFNVWELAYLC